MQLEHYNPELKIADDAFAWRYLSFNYLKDLLISNKIHFSRLDSFGDKFEGLPINYKSYFLISNRIKLDQSSSNFKKFSSKAPKISQIDINQWQKVAYSSCWYITEENKHYESLAMWNWHKNSDSFVLKIKLKELIRIIENSLIDFESDFILRALYGKVNYLSLIQHYHFLNLSIEAKILPCFIKQNVFEYEKELRFVFLGNEKSFNIDFFKLNLSSEIKNEFLEIIAHPNISKQNYKKRMRFFEFNGFDIKRFKTSDILTERTFNRFK